LEMPTHLVSEASTTPSTDSATALRLPGTKLADIFHWQ
jgi:hypothetical protein